MLNGKKIIAIIPARGGSKRLPGKNIKNLHGKPMIAYTVEAARSSKFIDRVIVSTDDKIIAKKAKQYGAEIPFLRPINLATDKATTLSVLEHAIHYLEEKEKCFPELIVLIQPTSPLVTAGDIDKTIIAQAETGCVSCVTVCAISERPEWMYVIRNNKAKPFLKKTHIESSAGKEQLYRLNGAVYVMSKDLIMKSKKIIEDNDLALVVMPKERSVDVDDIVDFRLAESLLSHI